MTVIQWYRCIFFLFSTHILTRRMTNYNWATKFWNIFSTHILTRRMTTPRFSCNVPSFFQLTSSQGGWLWCWLHSLRCIRLFNSHPHKEDDISINFESNPSWFFNSHPHKEDDVADEEFYAYHGVFQLTSSQGGWRIVLNVKFKYQFSTHILTRRMTLIVCMKLER